MVFTNTVEGYVTLILQFLVFITTLLTLIRQSKIIESSQDQALIKDLTEQLKVKDDLLHGRDEQINDLREQYANLVKIYSKNGSGYNEDSV